MRLHGVPLELLKCQLTGDRSGPALKALHLLDLRAESIVEVDAQHLFRSHGIGYDAQVYLPGIGRVDFLIEGFLIVEVDGFAFHSSREALRRDLGRNNASTLGGYAVLRYMPEHIWFEPERVLAEIRAVLGRRSQPPTCPVAPAPEIPRSGFPTEAAADDPSNRAGTRAGQPNPERRPVGPTPTQGTLSGWRRGPAPTAPRRRRPSD